MKDENKGENSLNIVFFLELLTVKKQDTMANSCTNLSLVSFFYPYFHILDETCLLSQ